MYTTGKAQGLFLRDLEALSPIVNLPEIISLADFVN